MRIGTRILPLCVGLLVATITASQAADWTIVDLGALPGVKSNSGAVGINSFGVAVGSSGPDANRLPVKFQNGDVQSLGSLPGAPSAGSPLAYDINDQGAIVGATVSSEGKPRAFLYRNGVMSDLGTFGGDSSTAFAVNNGGVVVGWANDVHGGTVAFKYESGVMSPIASGTAMDINDHGLIVGDLGIGQSFTYQNGLLEVIQADGSIWAVNNNGMIVGEGIIGGNVIPAYLENGSWHGMAPPGVAGAAFGINDRDQVVGEANIAAGGNTTGFLYSNGVMHDLLSLLPADSGWSGIGAYDINDRRQIVGYGRKDGQWRAFLMTPTIDTFDLEVTYANPLVTDGDSEGAPAEVTARFVLEGIAGMPGTFRLEDVVSAFVEFEDGVFTELDLASFQMTLGPGGVDEILTLSYNFDSILTPAGVEISLRNNSFQLYVDRILPDSGGSFSYFYPDSAQSLSVVPEPSSIALATLAWLGLVILHGRRQKSLTGC